MEDELIDNLPVASLIKTEALAYMRLGEHPISLYVAMVAQFTDRTEREVLKTILGETLSFEIEERLAEIEFSMSVANVIDAEAGSLEQLCEAISTAGSAARRTWNERAACL